jgi:7-cyano-7-deazaguanine synthase in queuosine biosynthesis
MTKLSFTPIDFPTAYLPQADRHYVLYDQPDQVRHGSSGTGIKNKLLSDKILPADHAWDLLSIALAVVATDFTVSRSNSSDGWTRQLELVIAVQEPDLWNQSKSLLQRMLRFLTTDIWYLEFISDGSKTPRPKKIAQLPQDSVVLLSGGLDSLIGAIDLRYKNKNPYAVSQIVRGEKNSQTLFASDLGSLSHIQLNHNARFEGKRELSSRARSLIFLAYGVLMATSLNLYKEGNQTTLFVCENGFISLNPPLTPARLGSLSTRTTHPTFISDFQELLAQSNLNVLIENPYQFKTKGEMLSQCTDQKLILKLAHQSVSCGKFRTHNLTHCGRCVPCLIRRAAFIRWGQRDQTKYYYSKLSINDANHAWSDDVRSAAMAIALAKADGVEGFLDSSMLLYDEGILQGYIDICQRGFDELERFLLKFKKKW